MKRNHNFASLATNYLFSDLQKRVAQFRLENPQHRVISLSIGDTTQPLDTSVAEAFSESIMRLSSPETYCGYGPDFGLPSLRQKLSKDFYHGCVDAEEIFISDGAKVDLFRLLSFFGPNQVIAVQDPSYPAYVDIARLTGAKEIVTLPCLQENDFFPVFPTNTHIDILCLCSPNNPTGTVLNTNQLRAIVHYAIEHDILILFDAAYSTFIADPSLPKSIFEIPDARFCAIEINSFSKPLGFAGVRLGWTVVPKELVYRDGLPVIRDWERFLSTTFNGASIPAQEAGIAGLSVLPKLEAVRYYRENSALLRNSLLEAGYQVFGGEHAPYLWVKPTMETIADEDLFDFFLQEYHIAVTPGIGFGLCGSGFVRFSSLGKREDVLAACERLQMTPALQ